MRGLAIHAMLRSLIYQLPFICDGERVQKIEGFIGKFTFWWKGRIAAKLNTPG
jgi:hypothetical protein